MADERDRRRIYTPPVGVRAQTAPESWEGHDSYTPVDVSADPGGTLDRINRRVKLTARTSQSTLDTVSELRRELAKAEAISSRNEGKLDVLLGVLEEERKERRAFTAVSVNAYQDGVEVDKTRALSLIEGERDAARAALDEAKARSEYRRQLAFKLLAGLAAVWGLIATLAAARCS